MSTQKPKFTVDRSVPIEVPDSREYESEEDADLDRALVNAIDAASAAENDYLRDMLASELGSHYYETQ